MSFSIGFHRPLAVRILDPVFDFIDLPVAHRSHLIHVRDDGGFVIRVKEGGESLAVQREESIEGITGQLRVV